MQLNDIFKNVESLPIDIRLKLVDSILLSLNPKNSEIEDKWTETAEKRLAEITSGKVKTISMEQIIEKVRKKYY